MMKRLLTLSLRPRLDEIAKALRRHQIHAPVAEGPPGELAGLGQAQSGHTAKGIEHRADDRQAAMQMELDHILAGETFGAWKQQKHPVIEDTLGQRMAENPARRMSRCRQVAGQTAGRHEGPTATQAYDRYSGHSGSGRKRKYGTTFAHFGFESIPSGSGGLPCHSSSVAWRHELIIR